MDLTLSSGQQEKLRRFERLLLSAAVPAGLVAAGDSRRLWDRHILDSLRAVDCLRAGDLRLADLGSGAGLPGVPLAIALPRCSVALIEARRRRIAFLEKAILELELENCSAVGSRVEDVPTLTADVCLARAFADAPTSWRLGSRLLRPGGRLLYYAGRSWPRGDPDDRPREGRDGRERPDTGPGHGLASAGDVELPIRWEICAPGKFPWQGPVVMMGRTP